MNSVRRWGFVLVGAAVLVSIAVIVYPLRYFMLSAYLTAPYSVESKCLHRSVFSGGCYGSETADELAQTVLRLSERQRWWPKAWNSQEWSTCRRTRCMVNEDVPPMPGFILAGEQKAATTDMNMFLRKEIMPRVSKELHWVEARPCLNLGGPEHKHFRSKGPFPKCDRRGYARAATRLLPDVKDVYEAMLTDASVKEEFSVPASGRASRECRSERVWKGTMDATPRNMAMPAAMEKIANMVPNATVMVSLRDPVDRAMSGMRMDWYRKKHYGMPWTNIAEDLEQFASFREARGGHWTKIPDLMLQLATSPSEEVLEEILWRFADDDRAYFPHIYRSHSSVQLLHILRLFPPSQIILVDFTTFVTSRCPTVEKIMNALCLDPTDSIRACEQAEEEGVHEGGATSQVYALMETHDAQFNSTVESFRHWLAPEYLLRPIVIETLKTLGAHIITAPPDAQKSV